MVSYVITYGYVDRVLPLYNIMSVTAARMEAPHVLEAYITRSKKSRAIVYSHLDSSQTFCNDKIGRMIQAHIQACGELLNRIEDKTDQMLVEKDIADLKIILDLVRYVN
jgi:hypothetical protein